MKVLKEKIKEGKKFDEKGSNFRIKFFQFYERKLMIF